ILGFIFLHFGAESFIKGSSRLAYLYRVKPIIIGLTIVAFGTSAPEAFVSILAAIQKSEGISIGNIVGSNIANIGLVLGLSSLIKPIKVEPSILKRELPFMIIVTIIFYIFCLDLNLSRIEGGLLFIGIIGFILFQIKYGGENSGKKLTLIQRNKRVKNILLTLIGLILLLSGAQLLIRAGVNIALKLGVSQFVIGLTMIAIGTSLPELATSLVGVIKGESDISLGNIVGSNIFNLLFVMGMASLILPLKIESSMLIVEYPIMLLLSFLIFYFLKSKFILNRIEGFVLLFLYCSFIIILFLK
ncbi:calcium/sodium antiporter, partial [SCandidatus Aminicenantes bacterium Aminicenantia_JdfR_composite]|nr:calcium/sodium antiporter [SCandidatus Aminicenantes bacterium Aminicenantia_JdfR_composite]